MSAVSVKVTFPRRAPTPLVLIALIVASADAAPASRVAPKRKPVTNKLQSAINLKNRIEAPPSPRIP
jgi:hypothetical protein